MTVFHADKDRLVYESPLGRFDPLAVHRRLLVATGGQFNQHLAEWSADDDGPESQLAKAAAEEILAAAGRHAFGLPPFADGGPVDSVVLDAVCDYLEYLAKKGATAVTTPGSLPSSDSAV